MTSVNYNASATTALRTLQATNTSLESTQNRISTGLKIGEAKDNAAYWSISTTLKSDNKALGTVTEALSLGAATVDTAYQGLNKTLEVLDQIKTKLVAAQQDGVDKTAIGDEIAELQKQLTSIAASSSFSGENWLSIDSGVKASADIVSGFTRSASGVSIGTVNVAFSGVALLDASGSADGALDTVRSGSATGFATTGTAGVGVAASDFGAADSLSFTVSVGTGPAVLVKVDLATVLDALDLDPTATTASIETDDALVTVLNAAFKTAGVTGVSAQLERNATTGVATGNVQFVGDKQFSISKATNADATTGFTTAAEIGLSATAATASGSTTVTTTSSAAANTIAVTSSSTKTQLKAYVDIISKAAASVTAGAAKLGAVAARIDLQASFVNTLMDTIDKGVSGLIDADLSEESTRLQALQTKQQLGVQALSIANSSTQNILRLFQ